MSANNLPHSMRAPARLFDPLTLADAPVPGSVNLVGFGFDGTACFRKGTRLGPDAIRHNTYHIETYSPYQDRDTADVAGVDLGNVTAGSGEDPEADFQAGLSCFQAVFSGAEPGRIALLTLGGEHSVSYAPITLHLSHYPDLALIQLDAHADLRDGYEGFHFSHASIMRRSLDHFGPHHRLLQYGIRSGSREEFQAIRKLGSWYQTRDVFFDAVRALPADRPVYLTLDLDFFDPAFLPGTGTPEAGGEDFHFLVAFIKLMEDKHFVGADIVELSPPIDPTGNSAAFAAKVAREILLSLHAHLRKRCP